MQKAVASYQSGFSVIQLLLAMSIAVLLSAGAVPSFEDAMQNNRIDSAVTALSSELEYARSEAIKRNSTVTMCASSNNTSCNTSDWELGRIVFVDDGAGTASNASNGAVNSETILKAFDTDVSGITFTPQLFTTPGYLMFSSDGAVNSTGTFVICDSRGSTDSTTIRAINVSTVGQTRRAYDSDTTADDIVNNVSGANVTCS